MRSLIQAAHATEMLYCNARDWKADTEIQLRIRRIEIKAHYQNRLAHITLTETEKAAMEAFQII